MKQRGRVSAAALDVASPVTREQRPDAPYDLTDEQTEEWWAVVNRMPADWFPRETHGMLAQYCRHVVAARRVAQLIADHEGADTSGQNGDGGGFDIEVYDRLLKMQEREGRAISSLATKMRISQQATVDKRTQKPSGQKKPIWQRSG